MRITELANAPVSTPHEPLYYHPESKPLAITIPSPCSAPKAAPRTRLSLYLAIPVAEKGVWDEEMCRSQEAAAWLEAGNGEFRGKWAAGNFLPLPLDI